MQIQLLIEKYIAARSKTVRAVTINIITHRLSMFTDFLAANGVYELAELNPTALKEFQLAVEFKRSRAKTQYMDLREPKKFLNYLYQNAYTLINLGDELVLPKIPTADAPKLSITQALKLIEATDNEGLYLTRDKAITALFLIEKLSYRHIHELSILDLNLEELQLRIACQKKFITIKPETLKYLRAYLRTRPNLRPVTDWVFVDKRGKRIAINTLKRMLRKVKREKVSVSFSPTSDVRASDGRARI